MEKIGFKDLNGWLKTLIILMTIFVAIDCFYFLLGFFQGLING